MDAFIRTNNYEKAIDCYCAGATLREEHYNARNTEGIALVCYADNEGHSILWGTQESGSKETFDKMVRAAALTKAEIEGATGFEMKKLEQFFQQMNMVEKPKGK